MAYKLILEQKGHYYHAIVTGQNSVDNVLGYLQEVTDRCIEADCDYLLIEERLEGPRLDMAAVFEIAGESGQRDVSSFTALAYVDIYSEGGGHMQFAETVAVNRALPIRVFATLEQAESWIEHAC